MDAVTSLMLESLLTCGDFEEAGTIPDANPGKTRVWAHKLRTVDSRYTGVTLRITVYEVDYVGHTRIRLAYDLITKARAIARQVPAP